MKNVRWINRTLLAVALLATFNLTAEKVTAQDAAAAGAPMGNTTPVTPRALGNTTTTTTGGIPPSSAMVESVQVVESVSTSTTGPAAGEFMVATEAEATTLPNTGGSPALTTLMGLLLAGGALALRRRLT